MPGFSKLFPFLDRIFSGQQSQVLQPDQVGNDVNLTHELFKADIAHNISLLTQDLSATAVGAGALAVTGGQPAPGFVNWPYFAAARQEDVLSKRGFIATIRTGEPSGMPNGTLFLNSSDWYEMEMPASLWTSVPCPPLVRGQELRLVVNGLAGAGVVIRLRMLFAVIPIELVDWQRVVPFYPSVMLNRPF